MQFDHRNPSSEKASYKLPPKLPSPLLYSGKLIPNFPAHPQDWAASDKGPSASHRQNPASIEREPNPPVSLLPKELNPFPAPAAFLHNSPFPPLRPAPYQTPTLPPYLRQDSPHLSARFSDSQKECRKYSCTQESGFLFSSTWLKAREGQVQAPLASLFP